MVLQVFMPGLSGTDQRKILPVEGPTMTVTPPLDKEAPLRTIGSVQTLELIFWHGCKHAHPDEHEHNDNEVECCVVLHA
jgi:hypothetical protein